MVALREKQDILVAAITRAQKNGYVVPDFIRGIDIEVAFPAVIFSHDFAKAFWGERDIDDDRVCLPTWEYNLRDMVTAPSAVEYLEKFLKEEEYPL